jgi:hypothetical protein
MWGVEQVGQGNEMGTMEKVRKVEKVGVGEMEA